MQSGAQPEIADGIVAPVATGLDLVAVLFRKSADLTEAEPHRMRGLDVVLHGGVAGMQPANFIDAPLQGREKSKALPRERSFQRAIPMRRIDIDVAHLDAVFLRVAHDLRRARRNPSAGC